MRFRFALGIATALVAGCGARAGEEIGKATPSQAETPGTATSPPSAPHAPHKDYVRLVAISSQGWVASYGRDALRLWNGQTGKAACDVRLEHVMSAPDARLSTEQIQAEMPHELTILRFDAGGEHLVSGSRDGWLRIHRVRDCAEVAALELPHAVSAIAVSDGAAIWVTASGAEVQIWRGTDLSAPVSTFSLQPGRTVVHAAVDPGGAHIALATSDAEFAWAEMRSASPPHAVQPFVPDGSDYFNHLGGLIFDRANDRLVTRSDPRLHQLNTDRSHIKIWDLSGREQQIIPVPGPWHLDRDDDFALSADGTSMWFTSTSVDQGEYVTSTLALATLSLVDGKTTGRPLQLDVFETNIAQTSLFAFDRGQAPRYLAYGDQDGNVAAWELASGRLLFAVDKRAHGAIAAEACEEIFDHVLELVKTAPLDAPIIVHLADQKELAAALPRPGVRERALALCRERGTRPDLACYRGAATLSELADANCFLGNWEFPSAKLLDW
jgi:hypothetical protein